MTSQEFILLVAHRCQAINRVLASKAEEYASNSDRLHNFKTAAKILNSTPESALLGFMTKHLVSVVDLVKNCQHEKPSLELIQEKIGDSINYLILLEALLIERYNYDITGK